MTTIYDVLEAIRASATTETEKGAKFERLIKAFLLTDPVYAEQFSDVWLWPEYPDGTGGDTGIDLVARDVDTGHDVAIQCKFFAPTTVVSKPMIDTFLSASGKANFGERIIVSTSDKWNANAENAIKGQAIPVRRIGMPELEASRIDWSAFSVDHPGDLELLEKNQPRDYQRTAIDKVVAGFAGHDRGRLVMACGTGKTFTSLRLAEEQVGKGGKVLFLVPSINLLSQTVREWVENAQLPIRPLAVCSDPKSTRRAKSDQFEDISVTDLALPATTDVTLLHERLMAADSETSSMTVLFATYQSIEVVAEAQDGLPEFDLVVADEAHRTTGATLAGQGESAFVRVHDNGFLPAAKRLYMTATPRIYADSSKAKAGEKNVVLASMDDEDLFGPEFHRLGFGEAVERGLLTDYKVLVLTVDEGSVATTFQDQFAGEESELNLDDAAKIVGCWNGLAKRGQTEHSFEPDLAAMRRAIAFAGTIKASKRIEELFQSVADHYVTATDQEEGGTSPLRCEVEHVDGTMNALERNRALDWLREDPPEGSCRILTNARCLSEGVDVPALDAVMFLAPRKSVVDIVQSVGRVMRLDKGAGKQFGYIILPIGIPAGMTAEQALADNKRYEAVWEVLQALRAHDERFDALVNRLDLSSSRDKKVNVIGVGGKDSWGDQGVLDLDYPELDDLRNKIYARIVKKVGSREYWTDWAKDVAEIAERQITRIEALLSGEGPADVRKEFDAFLDGLRGNLNENITEREAIEMLAQHLITRPVFNALFDGDEFLDNNPVAQTMEKMLATLDQHNLDAESESLERFYDSVRRKVADVKDREGRQELIRRLYDTFFTQAFKRTADKLGIVYTPIEIVDFILRSADEVLRKEFGQGLTDENVHILDGFTGTGTFMVRLLDLGLIEPHDLARKYAEELHANEILLLAYYIAAVNIETTYLGIAREADPETDYKSFPGLILTDTFQSWEDDDRPDLKVFPENNERLERLKKLPITVIVGNPPYSAGQASANDNNANEKYPTLDASIEASYLRQGSGSARASIYDSYIRAIRWASLRVHDRGVVAFVTNGGFLDSNSADGIRKTLAAEFSRIYIFNLRGNQRTAGEQSRKEGGKVFGAGSRATVAITLLVKNSEVPDGAEIRYAEVDDYLTTREKLDTVSSHDSIINAATTPITPNTHGDWLNQRNDEFAHFIPLIDKSGQCIFDCLSAGLKTNRDAWVYGSSRERVLENVRRMASNFNAALNSSAQEQADTDSSKISWSTGLRKRFADRRQIEIEADYVRDAMYRPFMKQAVYFDLDRAMNEAPSLLGRFFPSRSVPNQGFWIPGAGSAAPFQILAANCVPDLVLGGAGNPGHFIGRWRYETASAGADTLLPLSEDSDAGERFDNVTDYALAQFQAEFGQSFGKPAVFAYVYGLLHSHDYRRTYAADLKKTLPRIPLVKNPQAFVDAGHQLFDLHLGYEGATPYPLEGLSPEVTGDPYEFFAVEKLAFSRERNVATDQLETDRSSIVYNERILLAGIPDAAHRYMLGSRSAIEWAIDRYRIRVDKASGIVNNPNEWSREVGDPRYIIDLLARIVTVSLKTMSIVDSLPPLEILHEKAGNKTG